MKTLIETKCTADNIRLVLARCGQCGYVQTRYFTGRCYWMLCRGHLHPVPDYLRDTTEAALAVGGQEAAKLVLDTRGQGLAPTEEAQYILGGLTAIIQE